MRTRASAPVVACLVAALLGCGYSQPAVLERVPEGEWGGDHVLLRVDAAGADFELDCAHGRMESPLRLDVDGRFAVAGVYVAEGGPTREDPDRLPARFSGSTDGRQLSFTVTLSDSGVTLGPLTVVRGRAPRLFKCA